MIQEQKFLQAAGLTGQGRETTLRVPTLPLLFSTHDIRERVRTWELDTWKTVEASGHNTFQELGSPA